MLGFAVMAPYVDVYALPIPQKNVAAYRRLAAKVGRLYREHGAIEYREFLADDLGAEGVVPFVRAVKVRRGEVLIVAVVGFDSRAHRNRVNKRFAADPRVGLLVPEPSLFDAKRMLFGGFKTIVDA